MGEQEIRARLQPAELRWLSDHCRYLAECCSSAKEKPLTVASATCGRQGLLAITDAGRLIFVYRSDPAAPLGAAVIPAERIARAEQSGAGEFRVHTSGDGAQTIAFSKLRRGYVLEFFWGLSLVGVSDFGKAADEVAALRARKGERFRRISAQAAEITDGAWWLLPDAFQSLGRTRSFSVSGTTYHGGWPAHPQRHSDNILLIGPAGVSYRGFKQIFTIPWKEVVDITVDGPAAAQQRITATRLVAFGVFALAAQKKKKTAVVIVTTVSGDQAVFESKSKLPHEISPRLAPIVAHIRKRAAEKAMPAPEPALPAPAPAVAQPVDRIDRLRQLVELRDAGALTEEEFLTEKARVLAT